MAEILLFHHVLGLTDGVVAFADKLRSRGHTVHTPDLFDGRRFDSIDAGVAYVSDTGFGTVAQRGADVAASLPEQLVYLGMSFGVVPAQMLTQTRPGAKAAVFLYSCVPTSEFDSGWPAGVPVQIHGMDADPSFVDEGDIDAARELVATADDAELFLYPGSEHLFAEAGHSDFRADAAGFMFDRVSEFLARVDSGG